MEFNNVIKEKSSSVWCSGCSLGGCKVDHFGEGINKDNDGIKSCFGVRQLGDKVHGDLFPWVLWDW